MGTPLSILKTPQEVFEFAEARAITLRREFGHLAMHSLLNPGKDQILSPPLYTAYETLSATLVLPEFVALRGFYNALRLELSWFWNISFRTPGGLFTTLPAGDLVIPQARMPYLQTALSMSRLQ